MDARGRSRNDDSRAPATRRKRGEGTVFQRADGRWSAIVEIARAPGGKRQRKTVYGSTLEEVLRRKREVERAIDRALPIPDEKRTTSDFLDWWLTEVLPGTVRPRTVQGYRLCVERYIKPALGNVTLARLGPEHVLKMVRTMEKQGLSVRTRIYARSTLRRALGQAVKWGWVHRNVATLVDPPGTPRPKVDDTLTLDEARRLVEAAQGDRLEALWVLVLALGLRKGEALALRWDGVDLDAATLRVDASLDRVPGVGLVRSDPKTERSRRTVHLPALAVAVLRAHKSRQAGERLAAGPSWMDEGWVFTSDSGTALDPRNVTRRFHLLCDRAELPRCRFHALRHTAATLLLEQGVPLDLIGDTLGHASYAFTKDVYAHATPKRRREAAVAMDLIFGS